MGLSARSIISILKSNVSQILWRYNKKLPSNFRRDYNTIHDLPKETSCCRGPCPEISSAFLMLNTRWVYYTAFRWSTTLSAFHFGKSITIFK